MKIMIVAAGALLLGGCCHDHAWHHVRCPGEIGRPRMGCPHFVRRDVQNPRTLKVARKDEFSVTITAKLGYDSQTVDIKTKVAGNRRRLASPATSLSTAGVVGMVTDAATGAHRWNTSPTPSMSHFTRAGKTPQPPIQAPEPDAVAIKDEGVPGLTGRHATPITGLGLSPNTPGDQDCRSQHLTWRAFDSAAGR